MVMSAPIQRDDGFEDARFYAPPWARRQADAADRPPSATAAPVAPPSESAEWDTPAARSSSFPGDRAMTQLRRRMSLEPEVAPEPPVELQRRRLLPWPVRIVCALLAASAAGYGIAPRVLGNGPAAVIEATDGEAHSPPMMLASAGSRPELPAPAPVRLVVEGRQAFEDEPLAVGISLRGAAGKHVLVLDGLAEGSRLTAGTALGPTRWRVAAADLDRALAVPPDGFVGAMELAVDLKAANDAVVDRQVVRLEWLAKPSAAPVASEPNSARAEPAQREPAAAPADPEETATLVKRGFEFLKSGDIAAARLVLQRAAKTGHAEAALALGASYDPGLLAELGVVGVAADVAQARLWYQRALELGSPEASRRIEQLALAEKR
jgi:hypothetical protein